jgi:putative hydrolase of the HAD superfamily
MAAKPNGHSLYQYILFDLDDTLYPAQSGLMQVIGDRILLFMILRLGIPADDATIRKRQYYQLYGTSLRGLMLDYNIDPAEFLDFVHDVDPADFFGPSPPLDRMLHALPLRKAIFTNSDLSHSERVLNTLKVRPHFDVIFDTHAVQYRTKPDPTAYEYVLDTLGIPGEACIMIEDKARNLIPAKDLGMTTILVGDTSSPAVDHSVPTIFHVENVIKNLLPLERS